MDNQFLSFNVSDRHFTSKLACFDLDHTLIEPKNNSTFPKDVHDWQFKPHVINTLKLLHDLGWSIVVFTNQKQGNKSALSVSELKTKFSDIQTTIGEEIQISVFAALQKDMYRKPFTGLWELFELFFESFDKVFYCGDAFEKKRFDDIFFAKNVRIPFIKPNHLFKEKLSNNFTIPKSYPIDYKVPINFVSKTQVEKEIKEIDNFKKEYDYIFIISSPASGKSYFCKEYLSEFVALGKDDYKTLAQYKNSIVQNLDKRLVFDNTNYTSKSRNEIIEVLPKNAKIGYIFRNIQKEETFYLNKYRYFASNYKSTLLPDVAIHTYFKNLQLPTEILQISHMIVSLDKEFWI